MNQLGDDDGLLWSLTVDSILNFLLKLVDYINNSTFPLSLIKNSFLVRLEIFVSSTHEIKKITEIFAIKKIDFNGKTCIYSS